jgi:hypothetical protein
MRDAASTAPTRVVVLDLVSLVLLAIAAGTAFGVALAGMTLLFASQNAHADTQGQGNPPNPPAIERSLEHPAGGSLPPVVPVQPGGPSARTMV